LNSLNQSQDESRSSFHSCNNIFDQAQPSGKKSTAFSFKQEIVQGDKSNSKTVTRLAFDHELEFEDPGLLRSSGAATDRGSNSLGTTK